MKAIVHFVKKDAPARKRVAYLANKAVLLGDWIGRDVAFNTESLLLDHHGGRGRKTRHVIISLERGTDLPDSKFETVAERFVSTFAPGSAWLGAVDRNTRSVHCHVLLLNTDCQHGSRTLNFTPQKIKQCQDAAMWSGGLLDNGRRSAIISKLSDAKKLIQELTYEDIKRHIKNGTIKASRCNKRNEVTSILFNGRKIRLSTLQRVALGRDPDDREYSVPEVGMGESVGAQPKYRAGQNRRRNNRNRREGAMDTAPTKNRLCKTVAGAATNGELRGLRTAGMGLFQNPGGDSRMAGLARHPDMGRGHIPLAP